MPPRVEGRWKDAVHDAVRDTGMDERLTVAEAAERLDITKEAVRKRIHRGTLRSDKDADGTVRVYVPASEMPSGTASSTDRDELVSELRNHVADLREQLEAERQAHAEARRLLLEALTKIPPAIEAPATPEARDSRVSPGSTETPTEGREGPQMGPERPWWRRVFGG